MSSTKAESPKKNKSKWNFIESDSESDGPLFGEDPNTSHTNYLPTQKGSPIKKENREATPVKGKENFLIEISSDDDLEASMMALNKESFVEPDSTCKAN